MKKFYSLFLSLIFLIIASAQAQVAGITDLFGNYKFTADVEFTTAGNNYKGSLLSESDVMSIALLPLWVLRAPRVNTR